MVPQIEETLMKKKTTIVMLISGTLLASSALADDAKVSIPDLDKVKVIALLFDPPGWHARLFPDGSGNAFIAGGGWNAAVAKENTFSFEEIYNLFLPHLKPNREYVEDISVFFQRDVSPEGMPIGGRGWLGDRETIRKLMYSFRDKMEWDKEQFKELFAKRPLVWGDDLDGNPIPGYVRTPYVKMPECLDPFADDPPAPKDGNAENATPQEARKTGPDNGGAQTPLPDREAVQPDAPDKPNGKVATASLPLAEGTQRLEAVATMGAPPSRLCLYIGILSALFAGVALWFIRRKN